MGNTNTDAKIEKIRQMQKEFKLKYDNRVIELKSRN